MGVVLRWGGWNSRAKSKGKRNVVAWRQLISAEVGLACVPFPMSLSQL